MFWIVAGWVPLEYNQDLCGGIRSICYGTRHGVWGMGVGGLPSVGLDGEVCGGTWGVRCRWMGYTWHEYNFWLYTPLFPASIERDKTKKKKEKKIRRPHGLLWLICTENTSMVLFKINFLLLTARFLHLEGSGFGCEDVCQQCGVVHICQCQPFAANPSSNVRQSFYSTIPEVHELWLN